MTLFEYLAVFVSIVLSFGVIRLLDGIPVVVRRGRYYLIHAIWVSIILFMHVNYWWVLWSFNVGIAWNYPRFLLVLASPVLLYSLAITLVPRDTDSAESWRSHFYSVHTRFFAVFAAWWLVIGLANLFVLSQPLFNGFRLTQGTFIVLCLVGAVTKRPRFHGLFVAAMLITSIFLVVLVFFQAGPLNR